MNQHTSEPLRHVYTKINGASKNLNQSINRGIHYTEGHVALPTLQRLACRSSLGEFPYKLPFDPKYLLERSIDLLKPQNLCPFPSLPPLRTVSHQNNLMSRICGRAHACITGVESDGLCEQYMLNQSHGVVTDLTQSHSRYSP